MTRKTQTGPMAIVEVDHVQLLLPMAAALKVVELLQKSVRVDYHYESLAQRWIVRGQPKLALNLVSEKDIVLPMSEPAERHPRRAATPLLER